MLLLQYGETALHVAYKWGSTKVQQLLIDCGADVRITNNVSYCYNINKNYCDFADLCTERETACRCGIYKV